MSGAMECRACDGTGWVEGGTAIRTPCGRCGGLGVLSDLVHRPEAPVTQKCECDADDGSVAFSMRPCPVPEHNAAQRTTEVEAQGVAKAKHAFWLKHCTIPWSEAAKREPEFMADLEAIAAAALSAERERLCSLTEEAVIEKAAMALGWEKPAPCPEGPLHIRRSRSGCIECRGLKEWEANLDRLRAALPLFLAPEVAKREAAERERDRQYDETVNQIHRVGVAEAARDRMREALEKIGGSNPIPVFHEMDARNVVAEMRRIANTALGVTDA